MTAWAFIISSYLDFSFKLSDFLFMVTAVESEEIGLKNNIEHLEYYCMSTQHHT